MTMCAALASPREAVLSFLQSTYEAGANLARWDRKELERSYSRFLAGDERRFG